MALVNDPHEAEKSPKQIASATASLWKGATALFILATFLWLGCVLFVFLSIWLTPLLRSTVFKNVKRENLTEIVEQKRDRSLSNLRWMHRDHQRRLAVALKQGRAEPEKRFVVWTHIPKTGTSFVNTLVRWGCPFANRDVFVTPYKEVPADMGHLSVNGTLTWDWLTRAKSGRRWLRKHCPERLYFAASDEYALNMHAILKPRLVRHAVSFFRIPKQRLYSSYLHINYHYSHNRTSRMSLTEFLQRPRFLSQHAKILSGRPYADPHPVSISDAQRAAILVSRTFAFVGLTEQFELSVRLFHTMFGGVPHRLQFENVRPSIVRYRFSRKLSYQFRYDESEFGDWDDHPDQIIYNAARRRFWHDVCTYRTRIASDGLGQVPVSTCLFQLYAPTRCPLAHVAFSWPKKARNYVFPPPPCSRRMRKRPHDG